MLFGAILSPAVTLANVDRDVIQAVALSFFKSSGPITRYFVERDLVGLHHQYASKTRRTFDVAMADLEAKVNSDKEIFDRISSRLTEQDLKPGVEVLAEYREIEQNIFTLSFVKRWGTGQVFQVPDIAPLKSFTWDKRIRSTTELSEGQLGLKLGTEPRVNLQAYPPSYSENGIYAIVKFKRVNGWHGETMWFVLENRQRGWNVILETINQLG